MGVLSTQYSAAQHSTAQHSTAQWPETTICHGVNSTVLSAILHTATAAAHEMLRSQACTGDSTA